MLNSHEPEVFRTALWERAQTLWPRVRRDVPALVLSAGDVEDLWSELLMKAIGPAGSPSALPQEAERWPDAALVGWLRTALRRDVIDEARRRSNSDGETWETGTALDVLADDVRERTIWRSLGGESPEQSLIDRAAVDARTADLGAVVGVDAVRLVVAEATGVTSGAEQRELLQMTRGRWRSVRDQMQIASETLRQRGQAALVWVVPESVLRWVAAIGTAGSAVKLGVIGIAFTGGAIATTEVVVRHEPAKPIQARTQVAPRLAAPAAAAVRQAQTTVVGIAERQRADVRASNRKRATQRRQAAKRRAATAERQATQQRATASAAATTTASRQRSSAAVEFLPGMSGQQAAPAPAAPRASAPSGRSAAAQEFLP